MCGVNFIRNDYWMVFGMEEQRQSARINNNRIWLLLACIKTEHLKITNRMKHFSVIDPNVTSVLCRENITENAKDPAMNQ